MLVNKKIKFFILSSAVFVLSGCQQPGVSDGLKILNDNLGKALNNLNQDQASSTFNLFAQKSSQQVSTTTPVELTGAEKQAIDAWLEKKGLNRYGDSPNAVYTGGTPLFNEKTGQPTERYSYILNKFPDILDLIKQGK
jgi:hypothetical protein